jgi:translation elongation factor EF-G
VSCASSSIGRQPRAVRPSSSHRPSAPKSRSAVRRASATVIHLLDTPGYADFLGHALPALAAVETAAVVINAQYGIEMMTGRFLLWAARRGLERLIIVN